MTEEEGEEGEFVAVCTHVHKVMWCINIFISKELNWHWCCASLLF